MTLPQHLEPLLVNHSPALNRALQEANTSCSAGWVHNPFCSGFIQGYHFNKS